MAGRYPILRGIGDAGVLSTGPGKPSPAGTASPDLIFTPSPIWRPHLHDRMTIAEVGKTGMVPVVSLPGVVHSEYRSGPNLIVLASAGAELLGRSGYFGLHSLRYRGFREIEDEPASNGDLRIHGYGSPAIRGGC